MPIQRQARRVLVSVGADYPEIPHFESKETSEASMRDFITKLEGWWWRVREVLADVTQSSAQNLESAGNQFFTNARARAAVNADPPITYSELSGEIGIAKSGPTADGYLSSIDWNTFNNKVSFTNALARAAISATAPVNYSAATGIISLTTSGFAASSLVLTAGSGLTGGGDLTASRSFAIDFAQEYAWTNVQNFSLGINLPLAAYVSDTEGVAYTGINNAEAGTPYAQVSDLNALRVAYENLRVMVEDLRTQCLQ
jgi:hypothetical protein